jgi:hypothetical protein
VTPVSNEPEDLAQLAVAAAQSYAARSSAETFLGERDFILYTLIQNGAVEVAEDGESATFTREWVDETWRNRRSAPYAREGTADRFPGSVEEFAEGYFKGALSWRDALTKQGRLQRQAWKALREEWRQTGRMQLGATLVGILRVERS